MINLDSMKFGSHFCTYMSMEFKCMVSSTLFLMTTQTSLKYAAADGQAGKMGRQAAWLWKLYELIHVFCLSLAKFDYV